jgi:NAD(P)-dependent dehydrogenase (short-subunit alcohol dehydrogenase family)
MHHLDGKTVVITGSTRGLGRAYALAAAKEGASVVVNGRSSAAVAEVVAEIEAAGGIAVGHPGDVADLATAKAIVQTSVERFGSLDGLVTNAALAARRADPWHHSAEDVNDILRVNTMGTMFLTMAALDRMVEQGGGSVVTVISRAVMGIKQTALYGASKGAVASWTYGLALDLDGTGVRINGLSPTAQTGMSAPVPGRILPEPESAAPMVVYLLSDLSTGVTGKIFRIMGTQITTLAPPRYHPSLEAESWTAEAIAAAVENELREQLEDAERTTHYPESAKLR